MKHGRTTKVISTAVQLVLLAVALVAVGGAALLHGSSERRETAMLMASLPRFVGQQRDRYPEVTPEILARYTYPPALYLPSLKCPGPKTRLPVLLLQDPQYAAMMLAAGQPSLHRLSEASDAKMRETYRFTWMRTFHQPVFVRVDEDEAGGMTLTATQLSGKGGYEAGVIEKRLERRLGASEAVEFKRALVWSLLPLQAPADCSEVGLYDGSTWLFEANDHGRYIYVRRRSPSEHNPVRLVGERFLALTGWGFEPTY